MLMTQRQYAAHVGVSHVAVGKAVRAGKIPLVEGKIDSDIADAVWAAHRAASPAAAEPVQPPAAPEAAAPQQQSSLTFVPAAGSTASEQAQLARARREKIELDMRAQRGELVPLREVEQAWGEIIIATRNRLLLIVDAISDPTARAQVDRLLREAFADVCKMPIVEVSEVSAA